ncbi:hypothetical protein Zmor_012849 [Zophobas morio]|uniref:Hexosyltransferase n=2 Tax=Zophobas morio TaxID=2755281 RepID=A0AA38I9R7_9CUCU|nr:hypothetical protein Zmor_012849 [Zophobas morio]
MHPTPKEFFIIIFVVASIHFYIIVRCRHAVTPLDHWPEDTPRNVNFYLNLQVNNLPHNFCNAPKTVLIFVHSRPHNKEARDAIRRTWGDPTLLFNNNASLFFLLGQTRDWSTRDITRSENLEHGDIIIEDFIDDYANLTLKSISMLKLFESQDQCKFLVKADEDLFVNVENLVKLVELLPNDMKKRLLMGRAIIGERRKNDYNKKWYAPRYMFLGHTYPKFLAGPAYLMSLRVARELYSAALELPLFHLEDVFVTGICAEKMKIHRWHLYLFTDYRVPRIWCRMMKLVTLHGFNPQEIFAVQKLLDQAKRNLKCSKMNLNSIKYF